jgi:probable phosphoglycerate mutase
MSAELRRRIGARRRIYLLRHGEVSYFDARGRPLRPDTLPLNAQGTAQAEAAREALRGIPIDRVIHSGLLRTRQTAEIVAGGRDVPIESREALREVAPGRFTPGSGAGERAGASFERSFVEALGGPVDRESKFLGGETFGSLEDRVLAAFRELIASPDWKHLAIVAHGGTNRVILLNALGAGLARLGSIEQESGCINLIDLEPGGDLLVRLLNYTPYAPVKADIWATTMEQIFLEYHDAAGAAAPPAEGG